MSGEALSLDTSVSAHSEIAQGGELAVASLADELTNKGLITEEFRDSMPVGRFYVDPVNGTDALTHILVGDEQGGAHHLPTIIGLDRRDRVVASVIHDPSRPDKPVAYFRKQQKVRDNGTYKAGHVEMVNNEDEVTRKAGGSTMFPNEWTTQDVLTAILEVSQLPGEYDEERSSFRHIGEKNGVAVTVITDAETGSIITGHPR